MAISKHEVTDSGYSFIMNGPCYIDSRESSFLVHFGDAQPASDTDLYFVVNSDDPLDYGGTSGVYIKSYNTTYVYVES